MNNTEEQHPVFIPRNFIEKGTFMGGMFKIRNAIEGGVLAILITIPVINLPLTLTVRIIILCMTALPAAMISLIGIGGESITAFLMNALRFLKNRRVIYRMDVHPEPKKKYRIKNPATKNPKPENENFIQSNLQKLLLKRTALRCLLKRRQKNPLLLKKKNAGSLTLLQNVEYANRLVKTSGFLNLSPDN